MGRCSRAATNDQTLVSDVETGPPATNGGGSSQPARVNRVNHRRNAAAGVKKDS